MGVLKVLFITLLLVFLPLGEITRITFGDGALTFIDIAVGAIALIWVCSKIINGERVNGKLFKAISIFILLLILSLVFNIGKLNALQIGVSASYILRWIAYASIYFIVKDLDVNFKKSLPYFMLVSGLLIILGGFMQYFLYSDLRNLRYLGWDEHLYRMFSSFFDPNFAGAFFVLFFLFIFIFFQKFKTEKYRYLLIIILILSLISILLTFSRSTYLMFLIGISSLLFVKGETKKLLFILTVFALGIFLVSKIVLKSEGTNLLRVASGEARLNSVNNALTILKDHPILGVGFDTYRYTQRRYGFINESKGLIHSAAGTDNSFLFVLVTTGVIGFISFIFLIYKIINLSRLKIKDNYFAVVLFASIISVSVDSFFINSLFFPQIMLWIWMLVGLTEST